MFMSRRFVSRLPWLCGNESAVFLQTPLIPDLEFEPRHAIFCNGSQFTIFDVLTETVGVEVHGGEPSRIIWLHFDSARLASSGSAECRMISDGVVAGRLKKKKIPQ